MISIGDASTKEKVLQSDDEYKDDDDDDEVQADETEYVPPSEASVNFNRESLSGDLLRQFRNRESIMEDVDAQTEIEINVPDQNISTQNQDFQAPGQVARDVNYLMNLRIEDGRPFAARRLRQLNLELSPSQPNTPGDGNCFLHAVVDQATE